MLGKLYWITGLSGSGKTTIGNALYYELKEQYENTIILDGDILKKIVGNKVGYSREERLNRARQYSYLCKELVDQGMIVIICTIAMFDEIREWNRANINGYVEIFLDVELSVLIKRDTKDLYSKGKSLAGIDVTIEYPKCPDIILNTDGRMSVEKCVSKIINFPVQYKTQFNRDTDYWNTYYKNHPPVNTIPSDFATFVVNFLDKNKSLIDLGCGNGRDSLFFIEQGLEVTGIDASSTAIASLKLKYPEYKNSFLCGDFVTCTALYQKVYDYCYSRWTLHSIDGLQEQQLLKNLALALRLGGKLFIEARSIHDDIYGKGRCVGKNSFIYQEHFRRFIDIFELKEQLKNLGLKVLYSKEDTGFAPSETSNPILIRLIAEKISEI